MCFVISCREVIVLLQRIDRFCRSLMLVSQSSAPLTTFGSIKALCGQATVLLQSLFSVFEFDFVLYSAILRHHDLSF